MLFLLAFVQQITLLILLFYWEPTKPSNDSKSYYIDFIFFIFYAICDNLWMAHNLSKKQCLNLYHSKNSTNLNVNLIESLLEKSHKLEKSPCVVLVYAYSIFCLGASFGYAMSIYFCFPIKLYLSIFFLGAFSFIYVMVEAYFYLRKKLV